MKLYEIYESVLVESGVESCVKLFGHEIFGEELGGSEKNTPTENRYHDEIIDFTDNMYGEELKPEFVEAVNNMKSCMKQYPDVLIPDNTLAYRGTMIPLSYFIDEGVPIKLKAGFTPYMYRAKAKIQSWTTNKRVADGFGDNDQINDYAMHFSGHIDNKTLEEMLSENMRIAFTLAYHTNANDFLFKPKYFDILSYHNDESEIIRINNAPIKVDAMIKTHGYGALSEYALKLLEQINRYIIG